MELDESKVTAEDWTQLEESANVIIKNATRDLILWSEVLKYVRECKAKLEIRSVADGDTELFDGLVPS